MRVKHMRLRYAGLPTLAHTVSDKVSCAHTAVAASHTGCFAIAGTLPPEWGSKAENNRSSAPFPLLQTLQVAGNHLTGTIPADWGFSQSFPSINALMFDNTHLSGELPAFNQSTLQYLTAGNSTINGSLDTLWSSTAPFLLLSLANTSISGKLPDDATALPQLLCLDLGRSRLHSIIPLTWLQEGHFLSHVIWLNVGQVWDNSHSQNSWKQNLCLSPRLYDADVLGQQLQQIAMVFMRLLTVEEDFAGDPHGTISFYISDRNQFASVEAICANRSVLPVLLLLWLTFVVLLAVTFLLYSWCKRRMAQSKSVAPFLVRLSSSAACIWCNALMVKLFKNLKGLGALVFYYYDLINNIVLLAQVWDTWPGDILLTIFFVHFAVTGGIVAFHWASRCLSGHKVLLPLHRAVVRVVVAVMVSPCMIIVVFLLDMAALLKELMRVSEHVPKSHCLQACASSTGWIRLQDLFCKCSVLKLLRIDWVDLECYDTMHNTAAALLQTIPTVILNSAI